MPTTSTPLQPRSQRGRDRLDELLSVPEAATLLDDGPATMSKLIREVVTLAVGVLLGLVALITVAIPALFAVVMIAAGEPVWTVLFSLLTVVAYRLWDWVLTDPATSPGGP